MLRKKGNSFFKKMSEIFYEKKGNNSLKKMSDQFTFGIHSHLINKSCKYKSFDEIISVEKGNFNNFKIG